MKEAKFVTIRHVLKEDVARIEKVHPRIWRTKL